MITPKDMERFTNNDIVYSYEELNQELTKIIIKKIEETGDISSFTRRQMSELKRKGGNEVFKKALYKTNRLTKKQKKRIEKLFNDIGTKSLQGYEETFKTKQIDDDITPELIAGLVIGMNMSNKELNKINKKIIIGTKNKFINAVDEAYKEFNSGHIDYNTVVKNTVRKLAQEGITLKTKDGRQEQIDVAVKRRLHDIIHQSANDVAKEIGKAIDYNCVKIEHSDKCRPSHYPIDAVVMSKEEFEKYEYLTEEYNCNHMVNYIRREDFEDKRKKREFTEEHKSYAETVKNYNKLQKANYYARQVRAKKDNIASGDDTKKAKTQLRLAQKKYREYCIQNNIGIDYFKTWKAGYNK